MEWLIGGGVALIVIASLAFTAVVVIVVMRLVFKALKESSGPEITGPALRGSARVLSMQTTGTTITKFGQEYYTCILGLRVEIPGRQPYDVTIRQGVHLLSIAPLQSGAAVAVQV